MTSRDYEQVETPVNNPVTSSADVLAISTAASKNPITEVDVVLDSTSSCAPCISTDIWNLR